MRRPLFRRESTLLLVTIVMLGLGGEAVTRLIHTFHPLYEDKLAIYRGHPIFHHWRLPDQHTVWRSWEFTTSQRTNRFGMAGPDVALDHPPGVERIALIGDSFIEGFSTQEDERITRVLERLLNERAREEVSNPETVAGASEGL
ncbi:MAG: hypothetical protein KC729_12415, partial [Candidatus Eisenbacteria bacterium]|nr:hypothetical protein [Candidatus Eisenbacteria bacterium]